MNQPYARVNLTLREREKRDAHARISTARYVRSAIVHKIIFTGSGGLSRILSILKLDCLQHARSVRGVYEIYINNQRI